MDFIRATTTPDRVVTVVTVDDVVSTTAGDDIIAITTVDFSQYIAFQLTQVDSINTGTAIDDDFVNTNKGISGGGKMVSKIAGFVENICLPPKFLLYAQQCQYSQWLRVIFVRK